jgi:hypothetical protein
MATNLVGGGRRASDLRHRRQCCRQDENRPKRQDCSLAHPCPYELARASHGPHSLFQPIGCRKVFIGFEKLD